MRQRMTTAEWIDYINEERGRDPLLAHGYWHGYTEAAEAHTTPMCGAYYLVRWKVPTVAVSHDDRDELLRLAKAIESSLTQHESPREEGA